MTLADINLDTATDEQLRIAAAELMGWTEIRRVPRILKSDGDTGPWQGTVPGDRSHPHHQRLDIPDPLTDMNDAAMLADRCVAIWVCGSLLSDGYFAKTGDMGIHVPESIANEATLSRALTLAVLEAVQKQETTHEPD